MNAPDPTADAFPARSRRVLLWLTVGAICWRWLLARHTPLPGVGAAADLWVAQQLAAGNFAALAEAWWRPWWALLLAPAVACGADAVTAAQIAACVLGGLTLWPVALAAERLRQGAGEGAAVVAIGASSLALAAGASSAAMLHGLLVALAAACWTGARRAGAFVLAAVAALAGGDVLQPGAAAGSWSDAWTGLRQAWSLPAALALLSVLPPRPRRLAALWGAALAALAMALLTGTTRALLPTWSPLLAVFAGVGLARLPRRLVELLLAITVAAEFWLAWHGVEPRAAVVERLVGRHLAERLAPERSAVADLPRLLFFAGQRPHTPATDDDLLAAAARDGTGFVVIGGAAGATVTAVLAGRFARYDLPRGLREFAAERGLLVLVRRE